MTEINKTKLNRFKSLIEKNKNFIDSKDTTNDNDKKYSIAISMSTLMEYFSINQDKSYESITEGGDDNKIDAFYYSDDDNEIGELVIIQSKYKQQDGATGCFHEDDIRLCIESCENIISGRPFQKSNQILTDALDAFKNLLEENNYPKVNIRLFFATNGIISTEHKKLDVILNAKENNIDCDFIDATNFGLDRIVDSAEITINLKNDRDKTDSVFHIQDSKFSGSITSTTINKLMDFYKNSGEKLLLDSNVRYLVKRSNVNKEIIKSFKEEPEKFVYLNNGISIISTNYEQIATGHDFSKVIFTNPSIINGGQTIATLYELYENHYEKFKESFEKAKILIRCYKVPSEYSINIATATNSQNPINLVDLKSNDENQNKVKEYFTKSGVGLITKKGEEITFYDDTITNENLLQVYASLYGNEPGKAKLSKAGVFKKYYSLVFTENINEEMFKKLFRCYSIQKFVTSNYEKEDKSIIQNGIFSIIYTMKKYSTNIENENIPEANIQTDYITTYEKALSLNKGIINEKSSQLKDKFSMNNLFKGNEIKDLIDLKIT